MKRGFEATGLLTTEEWEDPDIEVSLNQKNFDKVRDLVLYLATQNQRLRIKELLERLYLRGMGLVELYDDVLIPVSHRVRQALEENKLSLGHTRLAHHTLEEAMHYLFPHIVCRKRNGKTGLCGAPGSICHLSLNAISRILEVDGWECLNLGDKVPFEAMAEIVEQEPVNLVCITSSQPISEEESGAFHALSKAADNYRIPIVLVGTPFLDPTLTEGFSYSDYFPNFRTFRRYLSSLSH